MPIDVRRSGAVTATASPDGTVAFPLQVISVGGQVNAAKLSDYVNGATPLQNSSGNVANAAAVATLTSAASRTAFISGLELTASGATAGLPVVATVTGLLGGTRSIIFVFPAGVLLEATPKIISFNPPLQASGLNTNIVVTLPAGGAGNTNAAASASGYMI